MRKNLTGAALAAAGVVLLDQLTKLLATGFLEYGAPKEVAGDFLRLTLIHNYNSAFGLSFGQSFPYALVSLVIVAVIIFLLLREKLFRNAILYGLIIGGAVGNVIDRLRLGGYVVDFIDLGASPALRWWVFNVADAAVTTGVIAIVALSFFKSDKPAEKSGAPEGDGADSGSEQEPG